MANVSKVTQPIEVDLNGTLVANGKYHVDINSITNYDGAELCVATTTDNIPTITNTFQYLGFDSITHNSIEYRNSDFTSLQLTAFTETITETVNNEDIQIVAWTPPYDGSYKTEIQVEIAFTKTGNDVQENDVTQFELAILDANGVEIKVLGGDSFSHAEYPDTGDYTRTFSAEVSSINANELLTVKHTDDGANQFTYKLTMKVEGD